jgi:intracellular sulfur oxidation DsrE/DsrF family protein
MKKLAWKIVLLMALSCSALLIPALALAQQPDDAHALSGVKNGKVAWDITVGNPTKLLMYLGVIEETYDDLKRQGVEPDMVFAFHGPVLNLISTNRSDVPLDQEADYARVIEKLKGLLGRTGVRMEACSVATRLMGLDSGKFLDGIHFVGNTFVSQIGYQAKGYALIPIY